MISKKLIAASSKPIILSLLFKGESYVYKIIKNVKEISDNNIEELESHILDEIDNLKEKNLSEEEAFFIAKHRLGETDLISEEYSKTNYRIWLIKKGFYLLVGYFLINFIFDMLNCLSTVSIIIVHKIYVSKTHFPLDSKYVLIIFIVSTILLITLTLILIIKFKILYKLNSLIDNIYYKNKILCVISLFLIILLSPILSSYSIYIAGDTSNVYYSNLIGEIF